MRASTTGWSESTTPFCTRRSRGHATTDSRRAPRTRTWSIPSRVPAYASSAGSRTLKSPAITMTSPCVATLSAKAAARIASPRGTSGFAWSFEAWRFATVTPELPAIRTAWTSRRSRPCSEMRSCPRSVAACRGATRIAFACPARPERKNPWWARVTHFDTGPGQSGGRVTASKRRIPDQSSILGSAHTGTSWRQTTSGPSPVTSSIIRRR